MVWKVLLPIALLLPLAGCLGEDAGDVTIRWTAHGIPHITADDWRGLGTGHGYAFARDNLCYLMEEIVTVNAERSLYWGDGGYYLSSNGQTYTNLESDLFWQFLRDSPDLVSPTGAADVPGLDDLVAGYADGVNRYMAEVQGGGEAGRHADCRDADWLRLLTTDDVVWRFTKLQLIASSLYFAPGMVAAAPPPEGLVPAQRPTSPEEWSTVIEADRLPDRTDLGISSNAYAFGADATPNGRGMIMGNPHFSWHGPERFHQLHLTIPGELDAMGASLHGVPIVLVGFNEHVAWSHTVSTGWRFTIHELTLVPGMPTSYVVDGTVREMEARTVTVPTPDGPVEHTFYLSDYGPIIEFPLASAGPVPVGLDWTPTHAYALQDANAHNDRIAEQFLRFNQATSAADMEASLDDVHGIPWVNTIAADAGGAAFYADISVVPNITDEQLEICNTPLGQATMALAGLPILDGSRSACDWTEDPDAAQAGIIPAGDMPRTVRSDYVLNSNDSYWLPNPEERLEGYSPMIGSERSERSGRTRMGYVMHDERLAGDGDCTIDPDVPCDKMTLRRLQDSLFSARLYFPEHVLDDILATTCSLPGGIASSGAFVPFQEACTVLADWDRRASNDSRGIALFERFWLKTPMTWTTPFDAEDPVHTPRGYMGLDPDAVRALADAVLELEGAGIALDASVAEARCVQRHDDCIPIHGAHSLVGSPNYIAWDFDPAAGFQEVLHGDSYIQTVTWDDDGRVVAEALLSYSQSTDPASPYYADQTRLYSEGRWVPLPFYEGDVADATVETVRLRTATR